MHEVAQPTTPVLRLASPAARRLAPPLILCAATLAAVVPALLSSRPGIRSVALPMFASGAALTFGVGLYDLATRELSGLDGDAQRDAYATLLSLELMLSACVCIAGAVFAWLLNSFPGDQFGITNVWKWYIR